MGVSEKEPGSFARPPFFTLNDGAISPVLMSFIFFLAGINSEGYQERESFEFEFNVHVLSLGNSSLRDILTIFFIANKMTSK